MPKRRRLEGVVTKTAMTKTIVVRVDRMKLHPKYRKRFIVSKKFHVHAESGAPHVGDAVVFEEMRPMSRLKRWRVVASNK